MTASHSTSLGLVCSVALAVALYVFRERVVEWFASSVWNRLGPSGTTDTFASPARADAGAHPCRTRLTDRQYLQHMIPHHVVAIDVSVAHAKRTTNDTLATLLRALVWTQTYEVAMMKDVLRHPVTNVSSMDNEPTSPLGRTLQETTFSDTFPNTRGLSNAWCDPAFFDPSAHRKQMQAAGGTARHAGMTAPMAMTDKGYIDHMIPHHQVAVDMSKRLLEHTNSDFMVYLAYRIIRAQEAEIKLLHDLR